MANEKFCGTCGTKMSAEAGFCPGCGAKQVVAQAAEAVEAVAASAPVVEAAVEAPVENNGGVTEAGFDGTNIKKFLPFVGIGAAVIAVIVIAVVVITSLTKWTKIDPSELCRVTFEGLDGEGVPVVSFAYDEETTFYIDNYLDYLNYADEEAQEELIKEVGKLSTKDIKEIYENEGLDKKEFEEWLKEEYKGLKTSKYLALDEGDLTDAFEKAKDEDEALEMKEALLDCITFEIDFDEEKDKLKNGDKVKVEVDFDEEDLAEYDIKLTKTSFEVEVKGLMEGVEFDPTADVKVTFEGFDGNGQATIDTSACDEFVNDNFYFWLSDTYNLTNGNVITIYYSYDGDYDNYDYDYNGYVDEEANTVKLFETSGSKEITVSGLTALTEVNPFDYIDVVYSGTPDYPSISVQWKEDAPEYITDNAYISADTYWLDYVEGETFNVEINSYSSLEDAGYKFTETIKTYDVDMTKVPRFATAADVNADTYQVEMNEAISAYFDDIVDNNDYVWGAGYVESVSEISYRRTYFKEETDGGNMLSKLFVVKGTAKNYGDDEPVEFSIYVLLTAYDVSMVSEGQLSAYDTYWTYYSSSESLDDLTDYTETNENGVVTKF